MIRITKPHGIDSFFNPRRMSKSAGCGRADFYIDGESGKLRCMNQAMGKDFLKTLFDFVLENTELDMK